MMGISGLHRRQVETTNSYHSPTFLRIHHKLIGIINMYFRTDFGKEKHIMSATTPGRVRVDL